MYSTMIFESGMLPVIHELLPAGVIGGEIEEGPFDSLVAIEGAAVPEAEYCRMRVTLALDGNVPVRTVKFEAVAA